MKRAILLIFVIIFTTGSYCKAEKIEVDLHSVYLMNDLSRCDIKENDRGGMVPWVFDAQSNLLIFQGEGRKAIRQYTDNFREFNECDSDKEFWGSIYVGNGYLVGDGIRSFSVIQRDNNIVFERYEKSEDEVFIYAINNIYLFFNTSTGQYSSYRLVNAGTMKRFGHSDTIQFYRENNTSIKVMDSFLYIGNTKLVLPVSQVDDDLNVYGPEILNKNGIYLLIQPKNFQNPYCIGFFDSEGNYWSLDFTKDEAQHPILLYAGRDWGYKEAPKKAKAASNDLIRLRKTADAFELGKIIKGQELTVLKTAETAIMNGITAPWYRIKTADGMIGWVFGSAIELTEK